MTTHTPNIVLIMTDQQRADLCKREGFPLDVTPFIDGLARDGVAFANAYTAAPACSPARTSMLTGRFPSAHRVRENRGQRHVFYESDLIDVLREKGYMTALIGKNHSYLTPDKFDHMFLLDHNAGYGTGAQKNDEERAFDNWLHDLNHRTGMEPTPFPLECQPCFRAVENAIEWVETQTEKHDQKPFFLWLSFPEPHNPYQIPEPYFSMYASAVPSAITDQGVLPQKGFKWELTRTLGEYVYSDYQEQLNRARSNYLGMLTMIDDQVQRFTDYLIEKGIKENTLLIFVSDHGDFVGEYGLMRKGPEMPELLMRVPLIFSGPGISTIGQQTECFVSIIDIFPTLCDMLGVALPPGVQGRSLLPILHEESWPIEEFRSIYAEQGYGGLHYTQRDSIDFDHCTIPGGVAQSFDELNTYSQSGTMRMVCKGQWKLVYDMQGNGQLYNLEDDPLELNNLFETPEYESKRAELVEELLTWALRMQDPLPYPVDKYRPKVHPKNYWTEET